MALLIVLSVIAGALGLYYYLFKDFNCFKKHDIPHKSPLPILGNMAPSIFRLQALAHLIKEAYDAHPDAKYVGFYDIPGPLVIIRDLELIKSITLKNFESFMDHQFSIRHDLDPVFSQMLFSIQGDRWRVVRSVMSPTFTSSKMKSMYKLMAECAVSFVEYLAQLPADKRASIDTKDIFSRYTSDVIATCAFGVSVDSMRNPNNEFYLNGKKATLLNIATFFKFYIMRRLPLAAQIFKLKIISDNVVSFFRDLIKITVQVREENGIVRPDMLQQMMDNRKNENGKELTYDEMIAQLFNFFLAGFDGISTLLCFAAHEIAVNRDIQDRLQNEIDQVLEDTSGEAPYDAINSMEYLDAVIDEALRMYPIATLLDRICIKDFELPPTLPGKRPFTIKKGMGVWVPVYGLHYDPKYFHEPEKFDPERFMGEQKTKILNSGAYCPFGVGPRMCIGNRFALLETKVLLFHLLARCDLGICKKTPIPIKLASDGFNMKPVGGFWLKMESRKNLHRTVAVMGGVANGTL